MLYLVQLFEVGRVRLCHHVSFIPDVQDQCYAECKVYLVLLQPLCYLREELHFDEDDL